MVFLWFGIVGSCLLRRQKVHSRNLLRLRLKLLNTERLKINHFLIKLITGFGDFVPAQGEKDIPEVSIGLCSLYLLFGIALLAMSFNLVQEEVINNVKSVAKRLGIIKDDEIEE